MRRDAGPACYRAVHPEAVDAVFRKRCAPQAADDPSAPLRIRSLTEQHVYLYPADAPSIAAEAAHRKNREAIEDTRLYIEQHSEADLSVQQLAARLFFSPDYLTRLFKSVTGELPPRVRSQKAIRLLLFTDMSASAIAAATGFETPPIFPARSRR